MVFLASIITALVSLHLFLFFLFLFPLGVFWLISHIFYPMKSRKKLSVSIVSTNVLFCTPHDPVLTIDEIWWFLFYFFWLWNGSNHSCLASVPSPGRLVIVILDFWIFSLPVASFGLCCGFYFVGETGPLFYQRTGPASYYSQCS